MSARESLRIAVVGAGIAGLAAASALRDAGIDVTVFDKGRGAGGRMARRRHDELQFDHGAQYFTAREPDFERQVVTWRTRGLVAPWNPRLAVVGSDTREMKQNTTPRYVGTPAMNTPVKSLAEDIPLRLETKVTGLDRNDSGYSLRTENGESVAGFNAVLLAITPEQAEPILPSWVKFPIDIGEIRLDPCWAVMVAFETRPLPDFDAAFVNDSALSWVSRNASKPDRPDHEAWVLHAGPKWSREHVEADREWVVGELLTEFGRIIGAPVPPNRYARAHRWRYARARASLDYGALWDSETMIGMCGDWVNGSRVEGAYLSGRRLSEAARAALKTE